MNSYNKNYEEKELDDWESKNFVIKKISPFLYSLSKSQQAINYLLLECKYSLIEAVSQSFKQKYFKYSLKLLNKKLFSDSQS